MVRHCPITIPLGGGHADHKAKPYLQILGICRHPTPGSFSVDNMHRTSGRLVGEVNCRRCMRHIRLRDLKRGDPTAVSTCIRIAARLWHLRFAQAALRRSFEFPGSPKISIFVRHLCRNRPTRPSQCLCAFGSGCGRHGKVVRYTEPWV